MKIFLNNTYFNDEMYENHEGYLRHIMAYLESSAFKLYNLCLKLIVYYKKKAHNKETFCISLDYNYLVNYNKYTFLNLEFQIFKNKIKIKHII